MNANNVYRGLLDTVVLCGNIISPRGQDTIECMGYQTVVEMESPIVTIPNRKINYRFMAAEAYWILTGQQGLDELTPYCARMKDFSDDGRTLSGAYGPRFVSQARYVASQLVTDNATRQAVMTIWERNPRPSKDIPCTVSLQWLLRNNYLHCIAHMRSQDVWLGWPYDTFTFTAMTLYIIGAMRELGYATPIHLGKLRTMVGSQHLYDRDRKGADDVMASDPKNDGDILPMTTHAINNPRDLIDALRCARDCPNDMVLPSIQSKLCQEKRNS